MMTDVATQFSVADAADLYNVASWGRGYFSINAEGRLCVHPDKDPNRSIDLKQLVDTLQLRNIEAPLLLRFNGILKNRVDELHDVFARAIADHNYQGKYTFVYPIKVNQQRQVVDQIVAHGRRHGFGLEAGSKPELLAVVAMTEGDMPIICNGFKDDEFIELAMLAQKIGRQVIPVVEKYSELELILRYAEKINVVPSIGMRVKLAARGSGRWHSSGGFRSKFGLTVSEVLQGLEELKRRDMGHCLNLLHFHLGSQLTNIRHLKVALDEAAHVYCDLHQRGAGLKYLDVGGGLGVDYDGSQTNFESSMNYTIEEYAGDVVYRLQSICNDEGVPHPDIISESGRAVAAYHGVLVMGVLGVSQQDQGENLPSALPDNADQPLCDLKMTLDRLNTRNLQESYHDAQQALDNAMNLFTQGYMPLDQRVLAERYFFAICGKIQRLVRQAEDVPEELESLDSLLSDTYFCNFSLFQSMPDSWAVKQLFPVMPIHRLNERPTRNAVLADITCDSDGKLERFVDHRDVRKTLPLHPYDGSPYYLGAFLVGAYQEILGDLHNLFGDTHAVHVDLTPEGQVAIEAVIKGDSVSQVLEYVQFKDHDMINRLENAVESAVRSGLIDDRQAGQFVKFYREALHGYTYMESVDP
ncbi:MAG: biosynthetic arginine decarboxylase [Planctomycetales bacterium]|nr:biosynthetic arginine decarboxylase [Planctomycetales bacterium]